MFKLYSLLKTSFKEKTANTIIIVTLGVMMIAPAIFKIEPEVMFSDKKEIVSKLSNELNVPTIYMFNSDYNTYETTFDVSLLETLKLYHGSIFNEEIEICKKCFRKLPDFKLKTRKMKGV